MTTTEERLARVTLLVEALRSGEYQQAVGALRVKDRFCCLGVACDVYRKQTGIGDWEHEGSEGMFILGEDYGEADLPRTVADWYGFPDENPELDVRGHLKTKDSGIATALNDGDRLTFPEIADAFERTYLAPASSPTEPDEHTTNG